METKNVKKIEEEKGKFQTRLQRKVFENELFMKILLSIPKIDYKLEKFGYPVEKLNEEKKLAQKSKNEAELDRIYTVFREEFKVSFKEQATILIRKVIELSKEENQELGFKGGKFYQYNGKSWEPMDKHILGEFLVEAGIKSSMKDYSVRQPQNKEYLLDSLASQGVIIPENQNLIKINLLNGVYVINPKDLTKGSLQEHNSNDGFTYVLEFEYQPDAVCSMFQKFLDRILPDKDTQSVILEYMAYCLTDNLHYEKALIAQGNGANGKSSLQNIFFQLIGKQNISSYSLPKLCDSSGYYRAELIDKRVNCCGELGSGKIDYDMFKQIVSGENIEARSPFGKPFNYEVLCKLWFNVNTLPYIESILALKRRLLLVPFKVTIPKEEINTSLANEICEKELSGIFNLLLKSLVRLVEQGDFTESKEINETVDNYMKENDTVRLFLDDGLYEKSSNDKVLREDLYKFYREYCSTNGYACCSSGKFGNRLRNLNYNVWRSTGGLYYVDCARKLTAVEKYNKELDASDISDLEKALKRKIIN